MSGYIVMQPLVVCGRLLARGDELPASALKPSAVASLIRTRRVVAVDEHGVPLSRAVAEEALAWHRPPAPVLPVPAAKARV